jgi:FMN phosphatase YigB (HAD superfamily)
VIEQPIRGVIFDLDGTLYSLKLFRFRITLALWRDIGILRYLSRTRKGLRGRVFDSRGALYDAFFSDLAMAAGRSEDFAQDWYKNRFMTVFVEMLKRNATARLGLLELLTVLGERRVRLAVVSDFDKVSERLVALDISTEYFDSLYCSADFGVLKPSARPIEALAKKWGLQTASLLVVGDRDDMDGASAKEAGAEYLNICDRAWGEGQSWEKVRLLIDRKTKWRE